jgi:hypothetical protein
MMNTAQVILEQLQTLGRTIVWSWGTHAYKAIGQGTMELDFGSHYGALVFKVQGQLFKGHVAIVLKPDDTYTIHIGHLRKMRFNTIKKFEGVYFDQMIEIIDENVETA